MAAAAAADVTVLCLGEEAYTEKPGDIVDLSLLLGTARALRAALAAAGATLVVVLVEGRPRTLHGLLISRDAVVHAMVPGPQGGPAIASLLYGEYAPSGRLPITYPKDEGRDGAALAPRDSGVQRRRRRLPRRHHRGLCGRVAVWRRPLVHALRVLGGDRVGGDRAPSARRPAAST